VSGGRGGWKEREVETARVMIAMYCRRFHPARPCPDCEVLLRYVERRIEKCPYGPDKPACSQCPIHCYAASMRSRIQEVMRFAGPRMVYRHPVRAIRHLLGKWQDRKGAG